MLPPTLAATFTLTSAFPLKWVLTLINEALQTDADITNGLPPGLVVAPAGGDWNSSTLAINLTMTAAFMAALTVGTHRFYMTAVSQRGLSGVAQIVLTVSL
jgi:sugar (pentulose or hexulose) kinase